VCSERKFQEKPTIYYASGFRLSRRVKIEFTRHALLSSFVFPSLRVCSHLFFLRFLLFWKQRFRLSQRTPEKPCCISCTSNCCLCFFSSSTFFPFRPLRPCHFVFLPSAHLQQLVSTNAYRAWPVRRLCCRRPCPCRRCVVCQDHPVSCAPTPPPLQCTASHLLLLFSSTSPATEDHQQQPTATLCSPHSNLLLPSSPSFFSVFSVSVSPSCFCVRVCVYQPPPPSAVVCLQPHPRSFQFLLRPCFSLSSFSLSSFFCSGVVSCLRPLPPCALRPLLQQQFLLSFADNQPYPPHQ
jgi:hypothetical protein